MTKKEWVEAFEEIYGRKPSPEEFQAAKQSGEFSDEEQVAPSQPTNSAFTAQSHIDSTIAEEETSVRPNSNQSIFCQSCGQQNIMGQRQCLSCGQSLFITNETEHGQYIVNSNLFSYLKYCLDHKKWAVVIYFIVTLVLIAWFGNAVFGAVGALIIVLPILSSLYMVSESGQTLVCRLLGAKRIERQEHLEYIKQPINQIISKARKQGLELPENIEIMLIDNEIPVAYAVGMNRIIVSEGLVRNSQFLEAKVMFELSRIHHKSPNLLLIVTGANLLLIILGLIALLMGGFQKDYGDRRKSFWTGSSQAADGALLYYGTLALLAALLGVTFLFVRSVVKRDVALSDQYMASYGVGQIHCLYLDKISVYDKSKIKQILELGFPSINERIARMQTQFGVHYSAH